MPLPADTLQTHTGIIGGVVSAATDVFSIGKAIITSAAVMGGIVYVFKKFSTYLTEHHSNVGKHYTDRETAVDKKEDLLFANTASERKENFELMRDMLKENAQQTAAILANADAIKENIAATKLSAENTSRMIEVIMQHSKLLQENTDFVNRLSEAMKSGNSDILNNIHKATENAFANYIDMLQRHPEVANRLLQQKGSALNTVLAVTSQEVTGETPYYSPCAIVAPALPPSSAPVAPEASE